MPKITVNSARLRTATVRQVSVQVDFTVDNPYAAPLPALGVDYQLYLTERAYTHFPDVSARNPQTKLAVSWILN